MKRCIVTQTTSGGGITSGLFWLSEMQWEAIGRHLPTNQPGARRVDDRRVNSGIIHVLKIGCRWCDCPAEYGSPTPVCSRCNRGPRRRCAGPAAVARSKALFHARDYDAVGVVALIEAIGHQTAELLLGLRQSGSLRALQIGGGGARLNPDPSTGS